MYISNFSIKNIVRWFFSSFQKQFIFYFEQGYICCGLRLWQSDHQGNMFVKSSLCLAERSQKLQREVIICTRQGLTSSCIHIAHVLWLLRVGQNNNFFLLKRKHLWFCTSKLHIQCQPMLPQLKKERLKKMC